MSDRWRFVLLWLTILLIVCMAAAYVNQAWQAQAAAPRATWPPAPFAVCTRPPMPSVTPVPPRTPVPQTRVRVTATPAGTATATSIYHWWPNTPTVGPDL